LQYFFLFDVGELACLVSNPFPMSPLYEWALDEWESFAPHNIGMSHHPFLHLIIIILAQH
jgi:hypothetical protein